MTYGLFPAPARTPDTALQTRAKPTRGTEVKSANWSATGASKTGSLTVAAGERWIIIAAAEEANTFTISGGGQTYTLLRTASGASASGVTAWLLEPSGASTFTLTVTNSSTTHSWGWIAVPFTDSDGIGDHDIVQMPASSVPLLNLQTTASDSTLLVLSADYAAVDGASRAARQYGDAFVELDYFRSAVDYAVVVGVLPDVGINGVVPTGWTAPTGQQPTVFAVEIKGADVASGVTGTSAGTLPALVGAGAGDLSLTGTSDATLPALTGAGAATLSLTGTSAGVLPALTGAGAGDVTNTVTGTSAATLPALTGAGAATVSLTGSSAGTLPALTGAGAATLRLTGVSAATLPALTGAGAGTLSLTGTSAGVLPALTGSGAGSVGSLISGTSAGVLPALTGAGAASVILTGAGAGTLPALTGAGDAQVRVLGVSAATLPALLGAASALLSVQGVSSATLPALLGAGAGTVTTPAGSRGAHLLSTSGDASIVDAATLRGALLTISARKLAASLSVAGSARSAGIEPNAGTISHGATITS